MIEGTDNSDETFKLPLDEPEAFNEFDELEAKFQQEEQKEQEEREKLESETLFKNSDGNIFEDLRYLLCVIAQELELLMLGQLPNLPDSVRSALKDFREPLVPILYDIKTYLCTFPKTGISK